MTTRRTLALLLLSAATAAALKAVPDSPAPDPLPFVAIGDWGRDGTPVQRQVAGVMAVWASAHAARFVISTGDNFYNYGVQSVDDPKWHSSFENVYLQPALWVPWYVALGNHDYRGNVQAQIDYAATSTRWRMPARFYTVTEPVGERSSLQLFVLDTTPFIAKYRSIISVTKVWGQNPAAQRSWLEKELAASTAEWKIVVGHHPIYGVGTHGDFTELTHDVAPLLERYQVAVYLAGHDHSLQHLKVGSVHYLTSGGGSEAVRVRPDGRTLFAAAATGFLAFRVTPETLTVDAIGADGRKLHTAQIPRPEPAVRSGARPEDSSDPGRGEGLSGGARGGAPPR